MPPVAENPELPPSVPPMPARPELPPSAPPVPDGSEFPPSAPPVPECPGFPPVSSPGKCPAAPSDSPPGTCCWVRPPHAASPSAMQSRSFRARITDSLPQRPMRRGYRVAILCQRESRGFESSEPKTLRRVYPTDAFEGRGDGRPARRRTLRRTASSSVSAGSVQCVRENEARTRAVERIGILDLEEHALLAARRSLRLLAAHEASACMDCVERCRGRRVLARRRVRQSERARHLCVRCLRWQWGSAAGGWRGGRRRG